MSIGAQIRDARKARGMTQEKLAESLSVTRAAVANWEQERRLPDAEMMLRLSQVLDCQFGPPFADPLSEAHASSGGDHGSLSGPGEKVSTEAAEGRDREANDGFLQEKEGKESADAADMGTVNRGETDSSHSDLSGSVQFISAGKKKLSPKKLAVLSCAAVILLVLLFLALRPVLFPERILPYTAQDGTAYTAEQLSRDAERADGKAYVRFDVSLSIQKGDDTDFWFYELNARELNGIGFTADHLEQVYFTDLRNNILFCYSQEDMKSMNMSFRIDPNGTLSITGGLPVQDHMIGIGFLLCGSDDYGEPLTFPAYISL